MTDEPQDCFRSYRRDLTPIRWDAIGEEFAKDRQVGYDSIFGMSVSTVFLVIDHNYGKGAPILFETMVFADSGSMWDQYQRRYHTEAEAVRGHAEVIAMIRQCVDPSGIEPESATGPRAAFDDVEPSRAPDVQ